MDAAGSVALDNVTCEYPGIRALDGISIEFLPGEVHAVAGENGAGKSTLLKVLAGLITPVSGRIRIGAQVFTALRRARHLGVRSIPQEPILAPDLSIAENVQMGRLPRARFGRIDWDRATENTKRLLERVGLEHLPPNRRVRGLGMGEQQLIQVARALSDGGEIFLFDEPTSSLSRPEIVKLTSIIRSLRALQKVVVFVSHRLEEIFAICDRVSILRDGRLVGTRIVAETAQEELIRMMVGRELAVARASSHARTADPRLRVRLSGVSFEVHGGEIVGLAGLVGAGRTELLDGIFGARPLEQGSVEIDGRSGRFASPREAAAAGLAHVPEDRKQYGLALGLSVADNFAMPNLAALSRFGFLPRRKKTNVAQIFSARLQIRYRAPGQKAGTLSGGNQQKVVIGKWLAKQPSILLLDEPTRGVDLGARGEINRIICELAAKGMAVLVSSSELPELLMLCDRVLVLCEGHIRGELRRDEMSEEAILQLATPGFQTTEETSNGS